MIKKLIKVYTIVLFIANVAITDEELTLEKIKQKADLKKKETLVVKGFYIGMPLKEAVFLINHYFNDNDNDQTKELFFPVINTNGNFRIVWKKDILGLKTEEMVFATGNTNEGVTLFVFDKDIIKTLFGFNLVDSDDSLKEFSKLFSDAYNVPLSITLYELPSSPLINDSLGDLIRWQSRNASSGYVVFINGDIKLSYTVKSFFASSSPLHTAVALEGFKVGLANSEPSVTPYSLIIMKSKSMDEKKKQYKFD